MGELFARLNLTTAEQEHLGEFTERIKGVQEFFADAITAADASHGSEALMAASPWLEAILDSASAALPPLKFLLTLAGRLGDIKVPDDLAAIACSSAYIAAVQAALAGEETSRQARMKEYLALAKPSSRRLRFVDFQLKTATIHPFIIESDAYFEAYAIAVGFTRERTRQLLWDIHNTFVDTLRTIVSDKSAREKFLPFVQYMELAHSSKPTGAVLKNHALYQRRVFRDFPLLKTEPFALADVYMEPRGYVATWGTIQEARRLRTVSGETRRQLVPGKPVGVLDTVLNYVRDPRFHEAIVVEGPAGCGKSSFTLHLCDRLLDEGWRPIRIRMHHLGLTESFESGLADAIQKSGDPAIHEFSSRSAIGDVADVFGETVKLDHAHVCPWVVILDGWDEISISATDGFKQRVERLLSQIRETLLDRQQNVVRVILTGRPSVHVRDSNFMRQDTVVLRILPLTPPELREYARKVIESVRANRVRPAVAAPQWKIPPIEHFEPAFRDYERVYYADDKESGGSSRGTLDVLGSPLLAHLALRLISEEPTERIPTLVESPTGLLRRLVDLTCRKAGQPDEYDVDPENKAHVFGNELRDLLRATAAAITACGEESIPHAVLEAQLKRKDAGSLQERVRKAVESRPLSELMISYYFKDGHEELGCEFLHKSFREFLFAEAVVEQLKEYGRPRSPKSIESPRQKPRDLYWQDFTDRRRELAHELAHLLAPQWITNDVAVHINTLIPWEIDRSFLSTKIENGATLPLSGEGWRCVRDALADIWDWWGEGVHLRPQDGVEPLALTLARGAAVGSMVHSPRITTVDSHLGDGLFRLCALVHYQLALKDGFLAVAKPAERWDTVVKSDERRYQSVVTRVVGGKTKHVIVFAPSGAERHFFENYIFRINAAGWRPQGLFPAGIECPGVDLSEAELAFIRSPDAYSPAEVNWSHSNFAKADLRGAFLVKHKLDGVYAAEAKCNGATVVLASVRGANFDRADLRGVVFDNVVVTDMDITHAHFGSTGVTAENLVQNGAVDRLSDGHAKRHTEPRR